MTAKRVTFWILLLGFAIGALCWFVYVPYRPSALHRLVPADAVFMTHHRALADRWDDFLANPLSRTLLTSAGLDLQELGDWNDDPGVRVWLDKWLARDVVLAHVPAMGSGRQPAWLVAGWIGGESVRLRWWLLRGKLDGIQKIQRHAGGSYWLVDTGDESSEYLSIAVVEGMLIGVFSADPHAVRYVLDVYDGLAPGHALVDGRRGVAEWDAFPSSPDRGWFVRPHGPSDEATIFFAFDQLDESGVQGALWMQTEGEWPVLATADIETPARFFGGIPFLVAGMHPETAHAALTPYLPDPVHLVVEGLYDPAMDAPLLVAVAGGAYAGTWVGISVPSFFVAWPVAEGADDPKQRVQSLLDRLNARFRWGLVATETRIGERPVYVIEGTADAPYARLRFRERIAFTVLDGWFIGSTHAFPLMQLVGRYERPEALFEADQGKWTGALRDGMATAYASLDIASGSRTLRLAISAYSVKLLFDDPQGSREIRQRLNEARAWIDTLEPMGSAQCWVEQQEHRVRLRFVLGETGD